MNSQADTFTPERQCRNHSLRSELRCPGGVWTERIAITCSSSPTPTPSLQLWSMWRESASCAFKDSRKEQNPSTPQTSAWQHRRVFPKYLESQFSGRLRSVQREVRTPLRTPTPTA